MEIIFDNPIYLLFLLSLPVLIIFHYITLRRIRGRVLQFANFAAISRISTPNVLPRNLLQLTIRLMTLTFIVLAVSGMSFNYLGFGASSDYVLAIDVSSSMSSTDIIPTRIEAAKDAAVEFVNSLPQKAEMGLVSFAGTAFVEQQMTEDKEDIINKIKDLEITSIGGTDLGEAIVTSSNLMLSGDNARSVILLTDGRSNIGMGIARAIDYANENNIQAFTIGIGTKEGGAPEGLDISLKLDEESLERISQLTEGEYIYAQNKDEIIDAYKKIISSTKKKILVNLTVALMFLALMFSFIDWMLLNTKYKRIP